MLGNIQFIGHLYRYGMLTENIMHRWVLGGQGWNAGFWVQQSLGLHSLQVAQMQ